MILPVRTKTGAISLAALTASILTANAGFEFTFSEDSDFEAVTIMSQGSASLLPTGGAGGSGGYGLGADSFVGILANDPFALSPGDSLTLSAMFQAAPDGSTAAPGPFFGIGLQVSLGSPDSIAAMIGLDAFGAADGSIRTDSSIDTSFSSGTGSFGLMGGHWYQATSTITKETTMDQWTVSLDVADYGVAGTSFIGSVYSATGSVSDAETYGVNEFYVSAMGVNGLPGVINGTLNIQAIDNFSVIPEPSTYAAIFGGLALLGACVYRRHGRQKAEG